MHPQAPVAASRARYMARQRAELGRRAVAVLPIHYPKELLTALDLLAVELWGPPGAPRGDEARRIQGYVCAVARNAFAFLAGGHADDVDGVLFPHTCDSIQGLGTLAIDGGGWKRPAFTFLHPRGAARESARRFLDAELRSLAAKLERFSGVTLTPERLGAALQLHAEVDGARAALLDGRARLSMTDADLYALLRRGELLWPEDHLAELHRAVETLRPEPVQRGIPLLVSGYVPEPVALLETLREAGAFVAADDYAAVGRRVVRRTPHPEADPWSELEARYWAAPPCSTRAADPAARVAWLRSLRERSGARGVIVQIVKFCEPELFDLPALRRAFATDGIPVLVLEGELERELSAQAVNRIEAFIELIEGRGGRT
jgi:benzoyl-CoA reductase/2-hydroxyglutaryl-CoA dehydratase subunit BcrC/BadD/HgdB